jgi:toxin-antitoxin system PIN domain toxin
MSTKAILVDSNVLIYAINSSSPKHNAAQAFLQEHIGQLTVAHQNILESLRVLTHKKFSNPMSPSDAIAAVSAIAERCHVVAPENSARHIAIALMEKHQLTGDKIFDAYLAATALSVGVKNIATDNVKDFLAFEGISIINPFG